MQERIKDFKNLIETIKNDIKSSRCRIIENANRE